MLMWMKAWIVWKKMDGEDADEEENEDQDVDMEDEDEI